MYIPLQDKKWEGWLIHPVIVFLCGNHGNKICVQYSSLFYKTLLHHSVHFQPPIPPPHPNVLTHICTPFHPNHSSLIQFVCCSSVGVSSVAIIMSSLFDVMFIIISSSLQDGEEYEDILGSG